MRRAGLTSLALSVCAAPLAAETLRCDLTPDCVGSAACDAITTVQFTIDLNQFAPAVDANDPPRRKVTLVTMGAAQFPAEPIWFQGGIRGFSAEGWGGSEMLFIVQTDHTATLVDPREGLRLVGTCEG